MTKKRLHLAIIALFAPALALGLAGCTAEDLSSDEEDAGLPGDYWENGYCPGSETDDGVDYRPASLSCNGVTYAGCCDENTRVIWCVDDVLYCLPCLDENPFCGWMNPDGENDFDYYGCTETNNGPDPDGEYDREC